MKTTICFSEDQFLENFHPLTLTRPVYDLRVGILTLGQKWLRQLGFPDNKPAGIQRGHLKDVFQLFSPSEGKQVLWSNPRFIPDESLAHNVKNLSQNSAITHNNDLIAARISHQIYERWALDRPDLTDVACNETDVPENRILNNSWELFQRNGEQIIYDIDLMQLTPYSDNGDFPHATLINPDQIYIEEGAVIEPGALLLADTGPIYIGRNARIMAQSVVRGPSAICEKSVVKMGAKIYEDTTIGPVCKVGGEVSNVIFHSYSNKGHDGYAGNSVFGQWCNLGADTNTSNLKNNYGTVKVFDWKTKKEFDTGQQFMGTIMGDHSKTGINSMLNTGTMCGVCCNLFSDKYPPKFVPSFSWVSGQDIVPYHFEKAIEAMEKMMQRRDVQLTQPYYQMMSALFQSSNF
jgi:UDP-N-acetylglucosamine diphosphorylase/glucosamine-1-phosphate N-acetyltransferase